MDDSLYPMIGRTPNRTCGTAATVSPTAGRAITPRDLRARLHHLEQCTSLSAEAALLAVLVARIGERECIVIHPGELVHDLSRHLHWRDTPKVLHPRLIGTWLRHLGFSPVGRDRLGMKYEIRWEQLWELDPRELSAQGEGLDLFALEGAELLRLLAQEQGLFFAPRLWCATCHRVVATLWGDPTARQGDPRPCPGCGAGTCILEKTWLTWASDRIRRAIRQDRNLLPTVKAEWEEMRGGAFPPLPSSFGWLNTSWESGKPSGRPAPVRARYELAHAVESLESAGVSPAEVEAIFEASGESARKSTTTSPTGCIGSWVLPRLGSGPSYPL